LAECTVSGLEFIRASAPINAVISSSSVIRLDPKIAKMALFAALIIISNGPPNVELPED
jgi:hypothetical protein